MTKFYALVILNDFTIVRMWMDVATVITFLEQKQCAKIYRNANDQEAILMPNSEVMWKDVPVIEKLVG